MIHQTKAMKERTIENHLRFYNTYQIGVKNCEQQLEYIMPSLVSRCGTDENGSFFFIVNDTEKVAVDRLEGKKALDLREEIEHYKIIISSIDNAFQDLGEQEQDFVKLRYFDRLPIQDVKIKLQYSEDRSVYRIRRHVLDQLIISLNNLLILK